MKKKYSIVMVLILLTTFILTGCSNPLVSLRDFFNKEVDILVEEPEKDKREDLEDLSIVSAGQPEGTRATILYYKDMDNLLVPVMRYIPKGDMGIAKMAIKGMIYSKELAEDIQPIGLLPTLPQGTEIRGATIKEDGLAIVDFTEDFLKFSSKEGEILGMKALVYTLTEFPNIESVQIMVDGEIVDETPFGINLGEPIKRSEINLVKPVNSDDKMSKVMVYYQKKGSGYYSYFVPMTKLVSGYKNSAEAALTALMEGPPSNIGLRNPFPEGSNLLGIEVNDGVAFVNFSEEILNISSLVEERALVKSIIMTLGEFDSIDKVRLFVNGKTIANTESIGADEYLDVPVFVNFYE